MISVSQNTSLGVFTFLSRSEMAKNYYLQKNIKMKVVALEIGKKCDLIFQDKPFEDKLFH